MIYLCFKGQETTANAVSLFRKLSVYKYKKFFFQ